MLSRSLTLLAALALAVPSIQAADGEGPGIVDGRPHSGERPEGDRPTGDRPPGDRPDGSSVFTKLDVDKSGSISQPEFIHGVRAFMEQRREGGDRPGADGKPGERPQRPPGGGDRPEHDVAKLAVHAFKTGDADSNGSLNEAELKTALGALRGGGGKGR